MVQRGWVESPGEDGSDMIDSPEEEGSDSSDVSVRSQDQSETEEEEMGRRKLRRYGDVIKYRENSSSNNSDEDSRTLPKRIKAGERGESGRIGVASPNKKLNCLKELQEETSEDTSEADSYRKKAKCSKARLTPASKSKKPFSSDEEDEDKNVKDRPSDEQNLGDSYDEEVKNTKEMRHSLLFADKAGKKVGEDSEDIKRKIMKRKKTGPTSKIKKPTSSEEEDMVENGKGRSSEDQREEESSDENGKKQKSVPVSRIKKTDGLDNSDSKKIKRRRAGPASKVKRPVSSDEDQDQHEIDWSKNHLKEGSSSGEVGSKDLCRKNVKRKKAGPARKVKRPLSSDEEEHDHHEKDCSKNSNGGDSSGEDKVGKKDLWGGNIKRKKGGPTSKVKKPVSSDEEEEDLSGKSCSDDEQMAKGSSDLVGPASRVRRKSSSSEDLVKGDEEESRRDVDQEDSLSDNIVKSEDNASLSGQSKKKESVTDCSEENVPLSRRTGKPNSSIDNSGVSEEEVPLSKRRGKSKTSFKSWKMRSDRRYEQLTSSRRSGRERKVIKENLAEESYGDDSEKQRTDSDPDSDFEEVNRKATMKKTDTKKKALKEDTSTNTSDIESDPDESSQEEESLVEETTRRSGRERKQVEKFVIEVTEVKKKKKRLIESSEESEEIESASENKETGSDDNSETDSEFEYEKKRKRKKRKKVTTLQNHRKSKKSSQRKTVARNSESDVSDSSENDYSLKNYKAQQKNKETKRKQTKNKNGSPAKGYGVTTGRVRANVNYAAEDESQSEDVRSDYDPADDDVEEIDQEGIHLVLDHRTGKVGATGEATMYHQVKEYGDPNEMLETTETETQYLIKWKDWAHIFNTWETEKSFDVMKKDNTEIKGLRKIFNYQNSLREYEVWRKRASPEDIEYQEIDREMGRNLRLTYLEVDRIFSKRKGEEQNEYCVKWKNLPYDEASWELEDMIKKNYSEKLECFMKRKKLGKEPNDYKDGMKGFNKTFRPMKEQPDFIGSETFRLRDYQLDGVNFLLRAWYKNNSVILADEMGLGKTIQTIAFLKYLWYSFNFNGPMLVCVPLSTIAAWQKEFEQWAPEMNCITYIGSASSREVIRDYECQNERDELSFNVILTSYEMVSKDASFFQGIIWSNIIVDEAHRLKNDQSLLYRVLTGMESYHRVLLTGTPLQNSLQELWCLLNYLQVDEIDDWASFEEAYGTDEDRSTGYVKLHTLLKPYIIRRMKKDVEKSLPGKVEQILRVDMTVRQKKLYKLVLTKNYSSLSKGKNQISLLNIMMQLRKACNHAELIQEIDMKTNQSPQERLKQIVYGSGKMLLLDKLLTRFKEKGDRVLIFSQMVIMLSILEEFLELKRYPYQILTGSVSCDKRKQSIAQFNAEGSTDFCFLLSTRAGGLGINLQTANRVIIFDSDFNPQNDLQAIARAHRIGQKEEVKIFRFVSSSSVDEDIIQRAKSKMVLDHLVIQNMDTTGKTVIGKKTEKQFDKAELNTIIKFGAADLFKNDGDDGAEEQEREVDLDEILEKAELREEEEAPLSDANRELLSAFKVNKINFEETEEDIEDEKDWTDIIPMDQRPEEEKPKQMLEGLELFSDTEDLYQPISQRRKARNKKIKTPKKNENSDAEDDDKGSDYAKDSSESDSSDDSNREELDCTTVSKNLFCCLECKKTFSAKGSLTVHMKQKHKEIVYNFSADNYTNLPKVQSTHNFCVPCGCPFSNMLMYQLHIAGQVHNGIEPPDNYDHEKIEAMKERNREKIEETRLQREKAKQLSKLEKMAEMQRNFQNNRTVQLQQGHLQQKGTLKRKICLICRKVFIDNKYLKQHMEITHNEKDFEPSDENNYTVETFKQSSVNTSNHSKILHKKNYVCTEGNCKKEFVEKKGIKLHMKTIHKTEEFAIKPENRLSFNKPFVTAASLASPEARPNLPKNCVPCGKSFAHHVLYQIHMRDFHANKIASPQKPTSYPTSSKMEKGEKLECLICHKKLSGKPNLKRHIKFFHMQIEKSVKGDSSKMNSDSKKEDIGISGNPPGKENNEEFPNEETPMETNSQELPETSQVKKNGDEIADGDLLSDPLALDTNLPSEEANEIEIIGEKKKDEVTLSDNEDDDPETNVKSNISERDKKLIEQMFIMMRKYGCCHCPQRYDTQAALRHHLKTHKKKVLQHMPDQSGLGIAKPFAGHSMPNVTITKMSNQPKSNVDADIKSPDKLVPVAGDIKTHDNEDGPVCFKCEKVCKDSSNLKNHILSHYYTAFDHLMPKARPFPCPECEKPSRDKISAIRHFAFTHNKLLELTDVRQENLTPGMSTPRKKMGTPKPMSPKIDCDDESKNGDEEKHKTEGSSSDNGNASNINLSDNEHDKEDKEVYVELPKKRKRGCEEFDVIPASKREKEKSSRVLEINTFLERSIKEDSFSINLASEKEEKMEIVEKENESCSNNNKNETPTNISEEKAKKEEEESRFEATPFENEVGKGDLTEKVQEAIVPSRKELQENKENDQHFEVSS